MSNENPTDSDSELADLRRQVADLKALLITQKPKIQQTGTGALAHGEGGAVGCGVRLRNAPVGWDLNSGFRIVASPSTSASENLVSVHPVGASMVHEKRAPLSD